MNEESLNKMLASLAVPAPSETAREKAGHRAEIAFANRHTSTTGPFPATGRLRWVGAFGVACAAAVMICFGMMRQRGEDFPEGKLLAEMEALFPGQLDGVISSGGNVSLDLAPKARAMSSSALQPLSVTLRRGRQIVRILSYSGRRVCVNLGGRKHCLEPLVTAEGKVIVEGDDFLWTDAQPMQVAGYRLEARTLTL